MMKSKVKKCFAVSLSVVLGSCCFFSDYTSIKDSMHINTYAITDAQQAFINNIGTSAQKNYKKYRILPSLTVAQAILESNWGKSQLSRYYYNFFGMKAGSSYNGETVVLKTGEEINGENVTVNGTFRVYHSYDEGIEGYYKFITGYSRYSNLIGENNYKEACVKIRQDGWATDSAYSSKLITLIESYNLTRFDTEAPLPPATDCFPQCGSGYTSIVEALQSIGAESSYNYRKTIAFENGISGYSGTAEQNNLMLSMLKSGTLKVPTGTNIIYPPQEYKDIYFPACTSGFASIVEALNSIGVNSSYDNRKIIATANNISGYSGLAEQNIKMLSLLEQGKLINPNAVLTPAPDTSGMYFPACSSSFVSIVEALDSIGIDSSYNYRKQIASKNNISNYSGTAEQNTTMLNKLKSGTLIRPEYVEPPVIVDCKVTLDATGGSSPIASMTIASNNIYNGLPTPTRDGYTFVGWFTSSNGGTQVENGNGLISASNHTLYAQWKVNTYNLTLDKNDASGSTSNKSVLYGSTYGVIENPTRKGYKFLGWYTDIVGGTKISSDTIYNIPDNTTVYAHWTAEKYAISFNLNGGSGEIESKNVEYDGIYGKLDEPSRSGFEFNGWYTAKSGGQLITADTQVNITSDLTLYAHWTAVNMLKIDKTEVTLLNGEQHTIVANDSTVTYKSNNEDVAVVSKSGVVTAIGTGSAIISVINADYDVVQLKVTVIPSDVATGDCNGDGEITVSDLVLLQKWLLNTGELDNWKNADLYKDNRIDVFDLIMLRVKIIERK